MIKIEVKGLRETQAKLDSIRRDLHAKVLQPAINKVADKARAEINRAIPEEYAVKAAEVRNAVTLRKAASGKLEATITVFGSASKRGRSMNMIHFLAASMAGGKMIKRRGAVGFRKADVKGLRGQLGFQVKRGSGLKKIAGAFVGNKGRTIFIRTGDKRLPIKAVQVIGFAQMFASRKISRRILDKIDAEFPVEIDRALARLMA